MTRASKAAFGMTSSLLLLAGCAAPINAPSAYTGERFLCGAEHATEFDALAATCRETPFGDPPCLGVASMKGDIDEEHFVLDSPLHQSIYEHDEASPNTVHSLHVKGKSPYFEFRIAIDTLASGTTTAESVAECQSAGNKLFSLEVRGSNNLLLMLLKSCEIQPQIPDGLRVAFSADFLRGGFVDACLYLMPKPSKT